MEIEIKNLDALKKWVSENPKWNAPEDDETIFGLPQGDELCFSDTFMLAALKHYAKSEEDAEYVKALEKGYSWMCPQHIGQCGTRISVRAVDGGSGGYATPLSYDEVMECKRDLEYGLRAYLKRNPPIPEKTAEEKLREFVEKVRDNRLNVLALEAEELLRETK